MLQNCLCCYAAAEELEEGEEGELSDAPDAPADPLQANSTAAAMDIDTTQQGTTTGTGSALPCSALCPTLHCPLPHPAMPSAPPRPAPLCPVSILLCLLCEMVLIQVTSLTVELCRHTHSSLLTLAMPDPPSLSTSECDKQ